MAPINPERRRTSARAVLLGTYPSMVAASDTLALSSSLTVSGRVRARHADAVDTAAACATSVSLACALSGLRRRVPMFFIGLCPALQTFTEIDYTLRITPA